MSMAALFRIGGPILAALAAITLCWLAFDRFAQKAIADAAMDCARAAKDPSGRASTARCLPAIRDEIAAARMARLCEASLTPRLRPETRFAMRQSCGTGVKRLAADYDAAEARSAALEQVVQRHRADMAAAIARAERRATSQEERIQHGRTVIARAPRSDAGSITCDDACLRALTR